MAWLTVVLTFVVAVDLCNSLIDEILMEGTVTSSIDENLAEDRREFESLLLSC